MGIIKQFIQKIQNILNIMSPRNFLNLFRVVREAPEFKNLTQMLIKSGTFQKFVHHTESLKLKGWQKFEDAAFPEGFKEQITDKTKDKKQK